LTSHQEVRATTDPLGLRGLGTCGAPGLGAAVANGVCDALRAIGVRLRGLPLTPTFMWEAIRRA
jgi:carbon-monoxide dehydrogenase large subunit